MVIEFDVNDRIIFPEELFINEVEGYIIVLAPRYPNWIVLNREEYELFNVLRTNTILDSLIKLRDEKNIEENEVISICQSLLKKIEECKFYKDVVIRNEDKMCDITKLIHINVTNDCNLRCKHCYLSAGIGKKQELDYDRLINFLDELYQLNGKTEVVISGGEPLLYKNIFKLLKYIKELGHKLVLFTNGILIDKDNIKILKEYVDEIQISMEGITKNGYESVRGKNTYKKLLSTIDLIKLEQIPLTLAITVLDSVIDDVEENLFEFLENINLEKINIRINDNIEYKGNAINLDKSNFETNILKKEKMNNIMKKLSSNGYNIDLTKDRNIKFSNCGIGTNVIINYDEKIYPCSEYDVEFFDMNENPKTIIQEFNKLNEETNIDEIKYCNNCELKLICNGGCRIKNFIANNSFIKPKCNAKYKEKKYQELLVDYLRGL